jgi:plasmid maintenance system antidote protein VapI
MPLVHPGEVPCEEHAALGLCASRFAERLQVPRNAVTTIVKGERAITARWRFDWTAPSASCRGIGRIEDDPGP